MKFSCNIENVKAFIPEEFKDNFSGTPLEKYCSAFKLDHIPVIERRRLSKGTKCVLSMFENIEQPVVYASYKGEINRSLDLLHTLAESGVVSPTSFSLSVLNAVPAVSSIMYKNHNDITAVSSNPSLENALLQAYINLCDTKKNQLVISYYEGAFKEYFKQDNLYCCVSMEVSFGNNIIIEKQTSGSKYDLSGSISEIEFLKHYNDKTNYTVTSDYSKWIWYFND